MGSFISYEDYVQEATFTAYAGTFPAGTPISNVGTEVLAQRAQTQNGDTYGGVIATFPGDRTIDLVAVLGHNWDEIGSVVVSLYSGTNGTGTLLYEFTEAPWAPPNGAFQRHAYFVLPAPVTCRSIRVVQSVSIDNYWYVGRIWAGPIKRFPSGIKYAWQTEVVDPSIKRRGAGQQSKSRRRKKFRRLELSSSLLTESQAFGLADDSIVDFQQLDFLHGITERCIVIPRDASVQSMHRLGLYATAVESTPIESLKGNRFSKRYAWEEEF